MPFAYGPRDHRIHYRIVGEQGPPVVLLHGLTLSGRFFFDIPEQLSKREPGPYQVIVVDNRGTGDSATPRRPYPMRDMADDVAAVLDAAQVDRALVLGISMGGMIAQNVALRHADRVAGLVLMSTSPGLPVGRLPSLEVIRILLGSAVDRPRDITPLARLLLPDSEMHRMHELLARWPEALRAHRTAPRAMAQQLAAIATHAAAPRLHKIRCPTHVVAGAEDVLLPVKNAELIAKRIPGATLEILPNVGHSVPALVPDIVERSLDQVLARASDAAQPSMSPRPAS